MVNEELLPTVHPACPEIKKKGKFFQSYVDA